MYHVYSGTHYSQTPFNKCNGFFCQAMQGSKFIAKPGRVVNSSEAFLQELQGNEIFVSYASSTCDQFCKSSHGQYVKSPSKSCVYHEPVYGIDPQRIVLSKEVVPLFSNLDHMITIG